MKKILLLFFMSSLVFGHETKNEHFISNDCYDLGIYAYGYQGNVYVQITNFTNYTLENISVYTNLNINVNFPIQLNSGQNFIFQFPIVDCNFDSIIDVSASYYLDIGDDIEKYFLLCQINLDDFIFDFVNGNQTSSYQDLNENGIIDVGDAIFYNYNILTDFDLGHTIVSVSDNNAVVTVDNNIATGIHYITQEEVDFGYVFNTAIGIIQNYCGEEIQITFQGNSFACPGCPNPNNDRLITSITPLDPHKISGTVKLNINDDDCVSGISFPYRKIKSTASGLDYVTFTNSNGAYSINIPNIDNIYSITALENLDSNYSSNPNSRTVNTVSDSNSINYNNQDFCISVDTDFNDVSIMFFNLNEVNPGFAANYQLRYHNNGTTVMNGTIALTFDDSKLQFTSATPAPDAVGTSTLSWNYSNLQPFESRTIPVNFLTFIPPILVAGDTVSFTATIDPIAGDIAPSNNTRVLNQIAVGSYDPNDKTVLEGEFISEEQVGEYLTYLTRFQNSGTANATFVIIREVLDDFLDWDTFTPLAESHNAHIELRDGNQLTYTFNDIDLPYEDIEPELSIGFMLYQIKLKPGFALGDVVSSSSDIYFDFNPPIFTNVVTTQIAPPMSVKDNFKNNFIIYPNPTASNVSIIMKEVVDAHYEITSITGERLSFGKVENINPIDLSFLSSSLYFITIITENERSTFKLIKK